jgi:TetR/AcrR family transcriptional repressor of bet genes
VVAIGREAEVTPSIINHYFGGKEGLLEATMRSILKDLSEETRAELEAVALGDPLGRVLSIVHANFSGAQLNNEVISTWLAFWSRAMHDSALYRLQQVNEKRLLSYLRFELKLMMPAPKARTCALAVAALIDGMWLRGALAPEGINPQKAESIIGEYVKSIVPERFILTHQNTIKGSH